MRQRIELFPTIPLHSGGPVSAAFEDTPVWLGVIVQNIPLHMLIEYLNPGMKVVMSPHHKSGDPLVVVKQVDCEKALVIDDCNAFIWGEDTPVYIAKIEEYCDDYNDEAEPSQVFDLSGLEGELPPEEDEFYDEDEGSMTEDGCPILGEMDISLTKAGQQVAHGLARFHDSLQMASLLPSPSDEGEFPSESGLDLDTVNEWVARGNITIEGEIEDGHIVLIIDTGDGFVGMVLQ